MIHFLLIIFVSFLATFQGTRFYKTKIDKRINLLVPSDFVPVPPDEISTKFISYRTPLAVYTNMTAEIEFGINTSVSRWRDTDIEMVRSFYKTNIASLYDDVRFLREEISLVNKRQFIIFEFISTLNPEERSVLNDRPVTKYTYIQYAVVRGTVYVFDFSSPSEQKDFWRPVVQTVMESVKIK
ncbi:MAG TPA: hypothetical protein VI583_08345 [Cyclobacteriaceae bacterium]|nr:hypothetical protein [Cyclobacteriaceae bacterium]